MHVYINVFNATPNNTDASVIDTKILNIIICSFLNSTLN